MCNYFTCSFHFYFYSDIVGEVKNNYWLRSLIIIVVTQSDSLIRTIFIPLLIEKNQNYDIEFFNCYFSR